MHEGFGDRVRKDKENQRCREGGDEADALVEQVDKETNPAHSFLVTQVKTSSSRQKESTEIEEYANTQQGASDPNKQLERIRIPIFSRNKMEFQQWFAAFSTCSDKTSLAPQFKMLRLEVCLHGEAAEMIKCLGYSQAAYDAAKSRLQRKYDADRRKVQAQIEELRRMRPVNKGDPKSMDKFADALERTIIVLKDNSLYADLGGGTLYGIVVEKLVTPRREKNKSYSTSLQDGNKNTSTEIERQGKPCRACGEAHHREKCQVFSGWSTEKKWEATKRFGVCYHCLNDDHLGQQCTKSKACNITGCKKTHHPLLHDTQHRQESKTPSTEGEDTNGQTTTLNTSERNEERIIALRTVPVILKQGKSRLLVNCFLDEGSDTTYVSTKM